MTIAGISTAVIDTFAWMTERDVRVYLYGIPGFLSIFY